MRQRLNDVISETGVYFIAEIGQNHQGDIKIAKKMVDSLRGTGVAAIKTAKRDVATCLTEEQKSMPYVNPNSFGSTYYKHRMALELSHDDFRELKRYSEESGFDFISSFTDDNSLDFLCDIGVDWLKIASQRNADFDLMSRAAQTGLPIILSTGMSDADDVSDAVDVFNYNELYLLQCTSSYPCKEEDIHLRGLDFLKDTFKVDGYGLSGHHTGIAPDLAAYVMGIDILERHYTLHRYWRGSDHAASLELQGVIYIMKYIDQIRRAMGVYGKQCLDCEMSAKKKLRG